VNKDETRRKDEYKRVLKEVEESQQEKEREAIIYIYNKYLFLAGARCSGEC